jgi:integrase
MIDTERADITPPKRPRHTGSLRKRNGIWWLRYWHHGERIEQSSRTDDKRKAARMLRDRLRTAGTPAFVRPTAEKLRFEDLCDLLRADHVRKGNRSRLEYKLGHLASIFAGDVALAISTARVDAYADQRVREGAQPSTVNRELAALRRAFRLAVRKGVLPTMPVITLLREDNTREGFIDPPDFAALCAKLREFGEPGVADATEFAYSTCLRRGNALGTLWSWFTLRLDSAEVVGGTVRLPGAVTKNGKPLSLALEGPLLDVIRRRYTCRVPESPYVFHRAGRRIVRFDAAWAVACHAVGLPQLLFHDLRRSGARNYRRAGVTEDVICRIGGWKTRSMFQRYNVVDERDLADAATRLSVFLTDAAKSPRTVEKIKPRATA